MNSKSVIILILTCNVITEDAKFIISFIISFNKNRLATVTIILTSIRLIFNYSYKLTIFVLLLLLQNACWIKFLKVCDITVSYVGLEYLSRVFLVQFNFLFSHYYAVYVVDVHVLCPMYYVLCTMYYVCFDPC